MNITMHCVGYIQIADRCHGRVNRNFKRLPQDEFVLSPFLPIYDLFKDAASRFKCTASNKGPEKVWEEAVVAYFKILSRNFPGGTEENNSFTHSLRTADLRV
jgi:hypothetical protein